MSRQPVIIDTDPGVDDAAALLLALASPEIELRGVSVVAGNVGLAASLANACRILALAGRGDVPVLAGAAEPLCRSPVRGRHARIGVFAEDIVPPAPACPRPEPAAFFIARQALAAAAAGRPITICAIGPLTNIALALRLHPGVAGAIGRIVMMGGAFRVPGLRTPWAEYNVLADPHAAQIVWQSGVPLVVLPLDVTQQALFTEAEFSRLEARGSAGGRALAGLLRRYDRSDPARYGRPGGPLHDPMTIAWLLRPDLFAGQPATIGVTLDGPTAGQSWADPGPAAGPAPNALVMTGIDEAAYRHLLVERIGGLAAAAPRAPAVAEGTA
ncbi:MAG: nucleoside hydrolase [Rhodospirillales bacterium]|nr:nucleoside hydrolase [Rhodospirillales bacterium]MDE2200046.1 nucleoside hydrolase [Rhodospirillales bacterium]